MSVNLQHHRHVLCLGIGLMLGAATLTAQAAPPPPQEPLWPCPRWSSAGGVSRPG